MIDFGSMLAFTTMYAVNGYFEDKERMKREKAVQYKVCFEQIGDNVAELGNLIIETVKKSGRVDLEDKIVQGAQRLPLYILLEIIKVQGWPATANQHKIVDICFNNFKHLGFTKLDYMIALSNNDHTREKLYDSVGLEPDHCGEFWKNFIELIYATQMSERDFSQIICCYSEIVFRLALLGDCKSERAEWIYNKFSNGLNVYMRKYAEGQSRGDKIDFKNPYNSMRDNCSKLDFDVNEDGILGDLFEYFIVALIIGYLEKTDIDSNLKSCILEYFMRELHLAVDASADEIYANYKYDPGMKQVFYDSANSWEDANYWKIQLISAIRAGRENDAAKFMEDAIVFMQLVEAVIISEFSFPEISGTVEQYMEEALRQMQVLVM